MGRAVVVAACSSVGTDDTPDAGLTGGDASIDPNCGRNTTPCPPGGTCEGASDCADRLCRDGECQETAPADGVKNGDETDVDCGGTKAPACDDGKGCLVPEDCTSQVCDPASKTCSPPSPTDGVANGDETDVDCGGASAPKCTTGQGCKASADCDEVLCDAATATCAGPAYDDGIENGDETGVDCGGPAAPNRCPPGQGCASDADCAATRCHAGTLVCDPPSATDGLKNGTESDVDCGGAAPTNAPKCLIGKTCAAGTDCESGG